MSGASPTCLSPNPLGKDPLSPSLEMTCDASGSSTGTCRRTYLQWNVTGIPAGKTITKVEMQCHTYDTGPVGNVRNSHVVKWNSSSKPGSLAADTVWNEISNGISNNQFIMQNTPAFKPIGNKMVNLGSAAVTDLTQKRGQGWWAFALVLTPEGRDTMDNYVCIHSSEASVPITVYKPKLKVTTNP